MKGYDKIKAEGGPFDSLILASAEKHGVNYDLLHKQLFLESSFNPKAKSPTGPRGIGQFTAATGKAYGLVTEEDFYDPAKSIEAAAQHMRDNIKSAKGDELKALLLYNQGGGRLGVPQLEAYDRGDFSGISDEGLNYMERLRDVAKTGRGPQVAQEAKPVGRFEASAGLESQPQVGEYQPQMSSMQFTGKDPKDAEKPWGQTLYEATGANEEPEQGIFTGLGDATETGIKNSPLGVAIRAATMDDNSDFTQTFTMMRDVFNEPLDGGRLSDWQDEDYDKLRNSELDPQFYDVVLRGYRRNFDNNLKLALENQGLQRQIEETGFGAQLVGGATEMIGDPYTLLGPGRGIGTGVAGRLAGGAVAGGAVSGLSESQSARVSGREENIEMAIAGGAAFGGLLNVAFGARVGNDFPSNTPPVSEEVMGTGDLRGLLPSRAPEDAPQQSLFDFMKGDHGPNEFLGPTQRLMAREKARIDGLEDDPTAMPYRPGEETRDGIVPYLDVPFDPSAARTLNGAIHSGGSPLNPKTVTEFADLEAQAVPKAQRGVSLGSISEVGYKLLRSDNESIRSIGHNLFRSPTGLEDGAGGKFGPAASDVVERLNGTDSMMYNRLSDAFRETMNDPFWRAQKGSKEGKMQTMSRRVVEALEDTSGTPRSLTPGEQKMLNELKAHMDRKWSMIENPGQFGNMDAKSLLGSSRHEGSYFPQRYDRAAKYAMTEKLGGPEKLQEAITQSWLASYMKRPAVRTRVDRFVKDEIEARLNKGSKQKVKATPEQIREGVLKYANDKAYGVSNTDQFSRSTFLEENMQDGIDLGANSYLEARNLFDSDVTVTLPDGTPFSVNDLREFDLLRVVPQYDRRVNGDIGIMAGTGKTTAELKQMADAIKGSAQRGKENLEAQALIDGLKLLTGRTRRDPDGAFGNLIRSINDIGFMTKNAYMAPQNFTEVARLFVNGQQKMLLKGVPLLKNWTTSGTKLSTSDIKDMHSVLFGKELDDLIRPQRADIIDRMREHDVNGTVAKAVGSVKYVTGEMAVRSPFTWALRESSNYIADAGRQGIMVDLANLTLNGKKSDLFTEGRLRSASVTPEQFKGIQALIKENFKRNPRTGKWKLVDANKLAADPRSMDLWRLGDRVADEVILRPHKMSNQSSKQYGAGATMALQFKMFVLRSINGRLVRGWAEATKNQQAMDEAFTVMLSLGLATAFYAARTHTAALGMPERKRQEYLDRSLSPEMLTYAALSRSSHVGAPLGVMNFIAAPLGFDSAAAVRTSVLPREPKTYREGEPMKYRATSSEPVQDFMSRTLEQVPSFQVLTAIGQAGYAAVHLHSGDRGMDAQGHRTGLYNALRQFVPNDPVSQNLIMRIAEDQGVDRAR